MRSGDLGCGSWYVLGGDWGPRWVGCGYGFGFKWVCVCGIVGVWYGMYGILVFFFFFFIEMTCDDGVIESGNRVQSRYG